MQWSPPFRSRQARESNARGVSVPSFLRFVNRLCAAWFLLQSKLFDETKKPPSLAVLSDIRFKLFQSARLPLLHRHWAGIAKVKIKRKAQKGHFSTEKTRFPNNIAAIGPVWQVWRCFRGLSGNNSLTVNKQSGGTAYRHTIDAQCRLADTDRHALPFLAADADAAVEAHVVTDHRHAVQHVGAVADQRRALDRIAELAVLDHVGFAGRKHELAVGDIDLAATE